MSDDEDWGDSMPDAKKSGAGMTKSVIQRARALNPQLAAQGSTTELFNKMTDKEPPAKPAAAQAQAQRPAAAVNEGPDILGGFTQLQKEHDKQRQKLDEAIAKLQAERNALPNKTFDSLVKLIEAADPNMTSPQTKELLRTEAKFLESIGFSIRKVIERRRQGK